MGNHQDGEATVPGPLEYQPAELAAQAGIEAAKGLVEKQGPGPGQKHAQKRHPSPLTARQRGRIAIDEPGQTRLGQGCDDPGPAIATR